jgi:geranylgeranyl reductase
MLKTKILIVGGGPAGSTAARILAENNIDVILLERNLNFDKPCGGGVPSSIFKEFRLPGNIVKREVKSIRIVSPSGKELNIDLKGGSLSIVERSEFDKVLRDEACLKGAKVLEGEFLDLSSGRHYVALIKTNGNILKIETEYIIGADGVNSKVRRCLGIKPIGRLFTAYERVEGMNVDVCEFWFGSSHAPNFYSWVFPTDSGISIGTGTTEPKKVLEYLRFFKERRRVSIEGIRKIYTIPIWDGRLFYKEKVLFSGDSAGQVLPLTYEGIYYSMKSAELAAKAIISGKIENYKKMWKALFYKRFILMDKLRRYFLKNDQSAERLVSLHRNHDIQEASMRLWLDKDSSKESLLRYIKYFGRFLN